MSAWEARVLLRPGWMPTGAPSDPLVAAEPSEAQRRNAIRWLADRAEDMPPGAVPVLLAAWAHPSLSPERQERLFEDYRANAAGAAEIRKDAANISRYFDEGDFRSSGDPQGQATALLEDDAKYALYELVNGDER